MYLQELFGSFPSSGLCGDRSQDADISDGEYQIYEQNNDDSCFDDDDED